MCRRFDPGPDHLQKTAGNRLLKRVFGVSFFLCRYSPHRRIAVSFGHADCTIKSVPLPWMTDFCPKEKA